ncbi:MAG TPA: FecR domain-containing protein [Planctomicrobium sp.]|nr:FecR domain-containing protein [Planctomicrobium sp.]
MPAEFSPRSPHPTEEMRSLVDDLYHGQINDAGLARMEELLLTDQGCLQIYVEHLDFHCELIDQADQTPPEIAALTGMQQYSQASAARESRRQLRMTLMMTASALLLMLGGGWIFFSTFWISPEIGTIISLSTHAQSIPSVELGQVVRRGEKFDITQGVVSLQLPSVTVDVIAPAQLRWDNHQRLHLLHGTVVVKVDPDGRGFTVRTPDAEVVDLGTEFLVQHETQNGSYVSVRRGEARAKLLDWRGVPTKVIELTASRAAQIQRSSEVVRETEYSTEQYLPVDRSRGGIRRLTGVLRTISDPPGNLSSNQLTTPDHMLVIPERQVTLETDLTVIGLSGPVTLPKGTTVSSYLIHYDPTQSVSSISRGSVTFFGDIAAIIGTSVGLAATDSLFGNPATIFETQSFRELELDEDEIQISDDRKTASFYFGTDPPAYLDECRILVIDSIP